MGNCLVVTSARSRAAVLTPTPRKQESCRVAAGDHDTLLAERSGDRCRPGTTLAGRVLQWPIREPLLTRGLQCCRGRVALQQVQDRRVIQSGAGHSLQRGMDLGELNP